MNNLDRYFTGKHSAPVGATWWDTVGEDMKQVAGRLLNRFGIPGFVRPLKIHDSLTDAQIEVRLSGYFTVISVDGRDFYFHRLSGKYDGSGMSVSERRS